MFNLYDLIKSKPDYYRQLRYNDALISLFTCPLKNKYEDTWSHFNYFIYVVDGRKVWHTAHGSYDLQKGNCVFVRKGASIIEQFNETASCFILFFMPDDFITDVLKSRGKPLPETAKKFNPVICIDDNSLIQAFFISMMPYFNTDKEPDKSLLQLKFKELVLIVAESSENNTLQYFFSSLLKQPIGITLQQVMEENFMYNLGIEEFARLSMRSLSAFKRDFQEIYQTSPGKWLLDKRLQHAHYLLLHHGKTVSEAAFESGFENNSHFSRSFKRKFGNPPVSVKQLSVV